MSRARIGTVATLIILACSLAPAWAQEPPAPVGDVLGTPPSVRLGAGQSQPGGLGQGRPIRDFLNPDGTLNLPPEGIQGGIDPAGFRLVSGPGDAPRFVEDVPNDPPEGAGSREEIASWPEAAGDECWDTRFFPRGINGTVNAVCYVSTTQIYIGGTFTMVDGVAANRIARWNGTAWSAMGSGMDGDVNALVWDGTYLYAGGSFITAGGTTVNRIARWGGSAWSGLGSGMTGPVYALALTAGGIFAGGSFRTAGGVLVDHIAFWNSATGTWSELGYGTDGPVYALAPVGANNVYAAGDFHNAGGYLCNNIAYYEAGSRWYPCDSGTNGPVYALANYDSLVWAGGNFTDAGGLSATYIASYGGAAWYTMGTGTNDIVRSLAWNGTNCFVGGQFTTAGGMAANRIASWSWSSSTWSTMGSGSPGTVYALSPGASPNVYLGGDFLMQCGTSYASKIAKWNGSAYSGVFGTSTGEGVSDTVFVTHKGGTNIYAGGQFLMAGSTWGNHVAKWNGSSWSALGSGTNANVYALAWDGTNLYAGGSFTTAGGVPAVSVARWNGTSWSALGSGMNDAVVALSWSGTSLYAGGLFTTAGGVPANRVARWDGSNWSALGSGMDNTVEDLLWDGANLYAGGWFTTAGGVPTAGVARWDGSAWSALGSGTDNAVFSLAWDGINLYAGGLFTVAGGVTVNRIAKWDGFNWSALGSGMNDAVVSLSWNGSSLYAGGFFTTAGGVTVNRVAKWDGFNWSARGSGTNAGVWGLLKTDDGLWAGGEFSQAGLVSSSRIAFQADPLTSIAVQPANQSACPNGSASFSVTPAGYALTYRWQENPGSGFTNLSNGGIYSGTTTPTLTLTGVSSQSGYQYRCVLTGFCGTGTLTSDPATLTIMTPPAIIAHPSAATICAGGSGSFSITASGTSPTYRWQVNPGSGWIGLYDDWSCAGSSTATLTLMRVFRGSNGYLYRCVATNACGQAISNSAALTVCDTPPSVGTLYISKSGNRQEITWSRIGNTSLVDRYEVMRGTSPTGPFDTLVGTATGNLMGIIVDLDLEPPTAYYEVRAVKGTCNGPLVPQSSIWLFDEGAGGTAYDSVNSNHGQIYNATWAVGQGVRGSALNFNGTNAFVSAVYPALPTGGAPYTLMAWVKPAVHNNGLIGWGAYCCQNSKTNALRLRTDPSLVNYWWGNDMATPTSSLVGAWHHVAVTWDGVNRAMYVDGARVAGPAAASGLAVPDTGNFRIGCTNSVEYFNGLIDEVAVFDEALGQSAIQSYMGGFGTLTPLDSKEAVWHFDDGSGVTLSDARGYHPATLHGGTWMAGQSGSAVDFNGTTDYAEANANLGPTPTGAITIVAKVWVDTATDSTSIVEKYAGESLDCWTLGFPSSGGKLCFTWNNAPPWANTIVSNSVVPLGRWVQLAVASNGTTATFYMDGVADGTFAVGPICTSGTTVIGTNLAGGDEYFDGKIDDLEVFDRYLTQAEIQALM